MIPVLHSARLTFGPATMAHFEAFAAFTATDDSRFLGGPGSRRDAWESVCTHAGQWTLRGYGTFWVTERNSGIPVGRVGLWHPDWLDEPELSWVIYTAHARRGFATEAAATVLDWAHHAAELPPLMSLIDLANSASIAVAERLGASLEGEHRYDNGREVGLWRHLPGGIR
jgi:RimJ/RimL family protein N-acetyltransferase